MCGGEPNKLPVVPVHWCLQEERALSPATEKSNHGIQTPLQSAVLSSKSVNELKPEGSHNLCWWYRPTLRACSIGHARQTIQPRSAEPMGSPMVATSYVSWWSASIRKPKPNCSALMSTSLRKITVLHDCWVLQRHCQQEGPGEPLAAPSLQLLEWLPDVPSGYVVPAALCIRRKGSRGF